MDFLDHLPFEVNLLIFSKLSSKQIFVCTRVCHKWRTFLDETEAWKLRCAKLGLAMGSNPDGKSVLEEVRERWERGDVTCSSHVFEPVKALIFKGNFLMVRKFHMLEIRMLSEIDKVVQEVPMEWLEYDFHPYCNDTKLAVIEVEDTGHLRLRVYPLLETKHHFKYLFTKQLSPIYYTSEDNVFFHGDVLVKSANIDGQQEIHVVNLHDGTIERSFPIAFQRPCIRYDGHYLAYYGRRQPIEVFGLENGSYFSVPVEFEDLKTNAKILSSVGQLAVCYSGHLVDFYNLSDGVKLSRLGSATPEVGDMNYDWFFRQGKLVLYREHRVKVVQFDGTAWRDYGVFGEETESPGQILGLGYCNRMFSWVQPSWNPADFYLVDLLTGDRMQCGDKFEMGFIPQVHVTAAAIYLHSTGNRRAEVRRISFQTV